MELENLQNEMNRLFNFSLGQNFSDTSLLGGPWAPAIDLYDTKDHFVAKVELPGIKKEDIEATIQDNILTIKGEKKRSLDIKEDEYIRSERFVGVFHRSVALPMAVDRDKVQAHYNNGVLELILPKKEEAKPKQIAIDVK
jgi:HSP20 family protein